MTMQVLWYICCPQVCYRWLLYDNASTLVHLLSPSVLKVVVIRKCKDFGTSVVPKCVVGGCDKKIQVLRYHCCPQVCYRWLL